MIWYDNTTLSPIDKVMHVSIFEDAKKIYNFHIF